jgi:hypothetical protein
LCELGQTEVEILCGSSRRRRCWTADVAVNDPCGRGVQRVG